MTVAVDLLTPPRGRAGDVITITGSGFSPDPGQNRVEFGVTPSVVEGTVLAEEAGTIQVVVPGGLTGDLQTRVTVTNLDDLTFDERHWFVLDDPATIAATDLPAQQPGPQEDVAVEIATRAEAKDFERLTAFISSWTREILPESDAAEAVGVGAERIGVDVNSLDGLDPDRTTLQGVLEALADRLLLDPIAHADAGSVGNVGAGEDVLHSFVLPAGTLQEDGEFIRMRWWGTIGLVSAISKRVLLKLKFGGSSLETEGTTDGGDPGFETGDQVAWVIDATVERTAAGAEAAVATRIISGEVPFVRETTHAVSLAGAVTVELTGENATDATNDAVVWKGVTVEVVRRRRATLARSLADEAVVAQRVTVEVL